MPYIITLKVEKVGGGSKSETLTTAPLPDAKMDNVVQFAWDDKAIDEELNAGGPGDDLNLDLDMFVRVVKSQVHGWYASWAARKAKLLTEPLEP